MDKDGKCSYPFLVRFDGKVMEDFFKMSGWTLVPFVFLQDMKQYQEETLVIRKSTSFYILICLLGFYKVDKCFGVSIL